MQLHLSLLALLLNNFCLTLSAMLRPIEVPFADWVYKPEKEYSYLYMGGDPSNDSVICIHLAQAGHVGSHS